MQSIESSVSNVMLLTSIMGQNYEIGFILLRVYASWQPFWISVLRQHLLDGVSVLGLAVY